MTNKEKILERLVFKLTSARFLTALIVIATYCAVVIIALNMVSEEKLNKDFFFGLFSGFSAIAGGVVTFYFTRPDRNINDKK